MPLLNLAIYAGIVLATLLVLGLIVTRLYRRASKEIGFVRTGFGGEKVVINGGALVLPVLHETMPVNLNTVRLDRREGNIFVAVGRRTDGIETSFDALSTPSWPISNRRD